MAFTPGPLGTGPLGTGALGTGALGTGALAAVSKDPGFELKTKSTTSRASLLRSSGS